MNQDQATITLQQMGISARMALGVREPRMDGETLLTRVGRRHHLRVELSVMDLYNLQIFSVRAGKVSIKAEATDVYGEDLPETLFSMAGEIDGF